ncbi:phage portal protein [Comamonas sp. SY3]|uniref:phage portal protein n=1 Tax=Comamonas sp. SY3 TaxID=3243601 RepID=UPI0035930991
MVAKFSANGKRIGRPPKAKPIALSDQDQALAQGLLKNFKNRYDGAGRGRRMASWNAPGSGPNEAINSGLQILRNRSSDAVRNDWSGESIVTKWSTALVGIAITPRFRRIKAKTRKQEINDFWADFVRTADADGVLDVYGMQTLAVRSWAERGEMFARRRHRRLDSGLPQPVQVQLLEADMVPNFDADTYIGLPAGNRIRSGIELDRIGAKVAYWVYKNHPGDGLTGPSVSPAAGDLVRVDAADMLHMFEPKRIGQRRGVPMLAPVLPRQRNIIDYEDVTLERQKIANLFVAFISRQLPSLDETDPDTLAALSGMLAQVDGEGSPLLPMKPGLLQELEDGQKVEFANPPEAGTNYSDYMRTSHLGTAAGGGLPYELMSGDIAGVSDRTLRVIINEFRRFASQRQWQIVIPMFCQRLVEWFADAQLLAGNISEQEAADIKRAEHAPHGWEYIHPVQDVQGKALEVKNGFRSRSSVIGEHGDDPDLVDDERAEDAARERKLGLGVPEGEPSTQQPASDDTDQDEIDNNEYSAPPNPSGVGAQAELRALAQLEAATERMRELFAH